MKSKRRFILCITLGAVLILMVVAIGLGVAVKGTLKDSYGQWVTAELVIFHHKHHGNLPADWNALEHSYGDGEGLHHGGMSFAKIKERMVVEFSKLTELQVLAQGSSSNLTIPKFIYPKSRRQSHWSGAEPNEMVYRYFKERTKELQKQ